MRKDIARIFRAGWIDSDVAFVDVLNDSIFIDHERCAIGVTTVFVEDSVVLDDAALGKVAEYRKGYAVLFGKLAIGINTVSADSENLCVIRFEFGDISLIRLHFLRSTTGKSKDVKGEHHILFALEVAQLITHASLVRPNDRAWQSEVRRGLPNLQIGVRRRRPNRRARARCRRLRDPDRSRGK